MSTVASMSRAQYRANEPLTRGNFYVGFAAGASMPSGRFGDAYNNGWSATVPIGWRPANGPLGIRLDLAYSKWGGATVDGVKLQSAAVWDGMLDATIDMPLGAKKTSSFYLVGGGGVHYFPDYGGETYSVAPGDTSTAPPTGPSGPGYQLNSVVTSENSSTTKLGLNGGAGFSFGLPHSTLFVETRYVTVFTKDERTNYWPIVGGLRWSFR
jgi:hypothetical protein